MVAHKTKTRKGTTTKSRALLRAKTAPTTIGVMARLAYARAKATGIDSRKLLRRARLSRDRLEDAHLRLNVQEQIDLTTLAADLIGDEYLGVCTSPNCRTSVNWDYSTTSSLRLIC